MNQLKLSGSNNYRFLNLSWTSGRSDPRLADQPEVAGSSEIMCASCRGNGGLPGGSSSPFGFTPDGCGVGNVRP